MSEYQYYEFQALDRPLDQRAMAELRALTSRAEITPTRLVNVYHFGDFRGNPDRLMDKYFDAFLYLANWGTRRLMLRLPASAFDLAAARAFALPEVLTVRASGSHVILDFHSDNEGDDDFEEGEGRLDALISLRGDLLAGDLRALYLGWLSGVESGEVDDEEREPPVPPGLGQLSAPLESLADFLRVDGDLIEAAAAGSAGEVPQGPSPADLAGWVGALPGAEKDQFLVRLIRGEAPHLGGELLQRFRKELAQRRPAAKQAGPEGMSGRTVQSLLEARDRQAEENRRKKAERAVREQAKRAKEEGAKRAAYLDTLAGQEENLWRQVEAAVATKQRKGYKRSIQLLTDLRDLGERSGDAAGVAARLRQLRERHRAKRTLIRGLDLAKLPG